MDLFTDELRQALPFPFPDEEGFAITRAAPHNGYYLEVPGGKLLYCQDFLGKKLSDRCLQYFLENEQQKTITELEETPSDGLRTINFSNIPWQRSTIKLFGKEHQLPRLTSWHGDAEKGYTYSGINSAPNGWNDALQHLKSKIEDISAATFNSVLLNWYRNGDDHLAWHADDEAELGPDPVIASVNLGVERDFMLRRNDTGQKLAIPLMHGTLLIMSGGMQQHWQHCVPKRTKIKSSRINLTFRQIQS